jgi:SAM-dependent methyltransferase
MTLGPTLATFRNQDPLALAAVFRDWQAMLRLHFLHAALESGLIQALVSPRTEEELGTELAVEDPQVLSALLHLGVALGELRLKGQVFSLRGRRSRALLHPRNDALAAMVQAAVTYYNDVYRRVGSRVRDGGVGGDLAGFGPLVARFSKITEPHVRAFIRRAASDGEDGRVLDVGCGSGLNLRFALDARPRSEGVGLEAEPHVAAQAEENMRGWGLADRTTIVTADARVLPREADGPFDLVMLMSVVYYLQPDERVALLREVRNRLGPGGRVILTTSCRGPRVDPFTANLNLVTTFYEGLTPLPTAEEVERQLREAGFQEVKRSRLISGTSYLAFVAPCPPG